MTTLLRSDLITNPRLLQLAEPHLQAAPSEYEQTQRKVRNLQEDMYAASSWPHWRRVLIKAAINDKGRNCRFVVTNIPGAFITGMLSGAKPKTVLKS